MYSITVNNPSCIYNITVNNLLPHSTKSKCTAIKLHCEKICFYIVHIIIAAMWCTNLAYSISAVISNYTDSDILDGIVLVMVISYFCGLGKINLSSTLENHGIFRCLLPQTRLQTICPSKISRHAEASQQDNFQDQCRLHHLPGVDLVCDHPQHHNRPEHLPLDSLQLDTGRGRQCDQ